MLNFKRLIVIGMCLCTIGIAGASSVSAVYPVTTAPFERQLRRQKLVSEEKIRTEYLRFMRPCAISSPGQRLPKSPHKTTQDYWETSTFRISKENASRIAILLSSEGTTAEITTILKSSSKGTQIASVVASELMSNLYSQFIRESDNGRCAVDLVVKSWHTRLVHCTCPEDSPHIGDPCESYPPTIIIQRV